MMPRTLRVGTRGSALARWQTDRVCEALQARDVVTEIVEIKTTGDLSPEIAIATLADPALFTRQLDEAMLEGRIDLAVHSLKDLPTTLPAGICLAAVGSREDVRDALITRDGQGFAALPPGARIATSSLRRGAQLRRVRPDLDIVEIRGNVDTRLAKLDGAGDLHATMLAVAGLVRLGLSHRITERLPLTLMLPAPGQAALAITARGEDSEARAAAEAALHRADVAWCVSAERALLHHLEGGCEVPVAAYAEVTDPAAGRVQLRACVVSLDGKQAVEGHVETAVSSVTEAEALGRMLADRLIGQGAARILEELRPLGLKR